MGRKRKALSWKFEGHGYFTYFHHPLAGRAVCLPLGGPAEYEATLRELNRIFMDPTQWSNPSTSDERIRTLWFGELPEDAQSWPKIPRADGAIEEIERAAWVSSAAALQRRVDHLEGRVKMLTRQLEHERGKKIRQGPAPELGAAAEEWLAGYKGRSVIYEKNVAMDVRRFVRDFGAQTPLDALDDAEKRISAWLYGLRKLVKRRARKNACSVGAGGAENAAAMQSAGIEEGTRQTRGKRAETRSYEIEDCGPIGPSRRNQIRIVVLGFLQSAGVRLDREQIRAAGKREVRARRGPIRWLQRPQAEALARALPEFWADMFRVQVGLGLRPQELITLQRSNFSARYESVTLAALEDIGLKTGSRTIVVPPAVRAIIKRRLKNAAENLVFPNPATGGRWISTHWFFKQFVKRLRAAGRRVPGITIKLDARIGRRTCGSLLVNAGVPIENVARILGDRPETVREHYASLLPGGVDPSKAAL